MTSNYYNNDNSIQYSASQYPDNYHLYSQQFSGYQTAQYQSQYQPYSTPSVETNYYPPAPYSNQVAGTNSYPSSSTSYPNQQTSYQGTTTATPYSNHVAGTSSYPNNPTSYQNQPTSYQGSSTAYQSTNNIASSTSNSFGGSHYTSRSQKGQKSNKNLQNQSSNSLSGSYSAPVGPTPPPSSSSDPPTYISLTQTPSTDDTFQVAKISQETKDTMKAASDLIKADQEFFPVSCGTEHKSNEPGYVAKKVPIRPDIMTKMTLANAKLEINPSDRRALKDLQDAMADHESSKPGNKPWETKPFVGKHTTMYHNYNTNNTDSNVHIQPRHNNQNEGNRVNSQQNNDRGPNQQTYQYSPWQPGAFTGQSLIEPMNRWDLDSQDPRTWARKDFFCNLKPLREGFGRDLMKRMGWREGKPLGKNNSGSVVPLEISVKTDRKGLLNELEEVVRKKPDGGTVKETGPNWMVKIMNNKHAVSGLGELHQAMGQKMPCYTAVPGTKNGFNYSVQTIWGDFCPPNNSTSKKDGKSRAAYFALKEILKVESNKFGMQVPYESPDSSHTSCAFIPTSKSCKGQALLYTNFYKGGELLLNNTKLEELITSQITNEFNQRSQRLSKNQKQAIKMNVSSVHKNDGLKGAIWIMKLINGKNCMAAVTEVCQAIGKGPPDYTDIDISDTGEIRITLKTPWGDLTPEEGSMILKEARWTASYYAIKHIIKLEAAKAGQPPPVEMPESDMMNLCFKAPPMGPPLVTVEKPSSLSPSPFNPCVGTPKPSSAPTPSIVSKPTIASSKPPSITTAKSSVTANKPPARPYYGRRR